MKYTNILLTFIAILLLCLVILVGLRDRYSFNKVDSDVFVFDRMTGEIYATSLAGILKNKEERWLKFCPTKHFRKLKKEAE